MCFHNMVTFVDSLFSLYQHISHELVILMTKVVENNVQCLSSQYWWFRGCKSMCFHEFRVRHLYFRLGA